MVRMCPRCRSLSQNSFVCARCGVQTVDAEPSTPSEASGPATEVLSIGNALLIGLLIAQGLTYALRHLAISAVLWRGSSASAAAFWSQADGMVVVQFIQALSIALAAVVAGAGQRRPMAVGASLGAINGLLFIAFQVVFRQPMDPLVLGAQPVIHAVLGAIGASIGGRIWRPAPDLPNLALTTGVRSDLLTIRLPEYTDEPEVEEFPWRRVALGIAVAVAGTFAARWIRSVVVIAGGGSGYEMQSAFITWQIAAIAQLVGGIIAGSNTRNGAVYGFAGGLVSAALIVLVPSLGIGRFGSPNIAEVGAWLLGVSLQEGSPAALIVQGMQALVLGFAGGWLGSLILPARIEPIPSRPLGS